MTFHDFRDMLQALYHILIHGTTLKCDTHIGTGTVAQALGVDIKATAHDNVRLYQMLYTLMDGCTGNITLCSDILERDACIL
jgi:hypothetical protein